ncbi:immunoglobulin lambda-1 light chain-like [Bombina bombina]|uniref:immunoglobulin lambda-1 light chain-like n=1 Tax=Bombina bombina TaxID=8345 RepID=UPI00235A8254|nr:immunoglobulin lambda-1 light chain-like [Bombina bombina]
MDSTGVILLFATLIFTSSCYIQVHQHWRVSASEGSTARLGCFVQGEEIENVNIQWLQQKPGKAPSNILVHRNNSVTQRAEHFPERFQIVKNSSLNAYFLHIRQVTTQDSALYWCILTRNFSYPVLGSGTRLSVFGGEDVVPPSVTLLSSGQPITNSFPIHIMCLVSNFFPEIIEVTWKLNGQKLKGDISIGPLILAEDNFYSMTTILEMPHHHMKNLTSLSCEVRHDSSRTLISKNLYECLTEI